MDYVSSALLVHLYKQIVGTCTGTVETYQSRRTIRVANVDDSGLLLGQCGTCSDNVGG